MAINFLVQPGGSVRGHIRVPGDKSISHRAIMLGSIADGVTEVRGFLHGADAMATLAAFEQMGVRIERHGEDHLTIHGVGMQGLQPPKAAIDLGNSGTAMRLMMGLLAGQSFDSTLTGDDSLRSRPMARVSDPLSLMGAGFVTDEGRAPITIQGGHNLNGIQYAMPMASAQVKSAILLAGLYADGKTQVTEPAPTRDHTERMLRGFGYDVVTSDSAMTLVGGGNLTATPIDVPADISSATFFLVAAAISPEADLLIEHVGVNPTRDGVLRILEAMGVIISRLNKREIGGEPVADLQINSTALQGIKIPKEWVPLAIDELPAIAIAAACAEGSTEISGAEELRVKECDRIDATVKGLRALGVEVEEREDGMVIHGKNRAQIFAGGEVESFHDHRISMAFSLAGLRAIAPIHIMGCDNVATSFPGYTDLASQIGLNISLQR